MNIRAGICEECGDYWTVSAGGLNDDGQCPQCEQKFPITRERLYQQTNDYELPLDESLAADGAGLGV